MDMISNVSRNASRDRKPLACKSCREKKVKCDRFSPCEPCTRASIECVFPTRRARVRREAQGSRDSELLLRIRRLEAMLAEKANSNTDPVESRSVSTSFPNPPLPSLGEAAKVDDHYEKFVEEQSKNSRHLNNEFWSSLTTEVDGLRQLMEGHAANEDDFDDSASASQSTEALLHSPSFIFQEADSDIAYDAAVPPAPLIAVLFEFYFNNFDPVCKILHRPTVNTYFSNLEALIEPSTRRFKFRSLEAVTFAAFFGAVTSMSSEECLTHLGEPKDTLSARYKRSTEMALLRANFLNSLEISTLQGLTIYIIAQRALNRGQSDWTLLGLAMRIAHGLGLHQDGDGRAFSAFEAEMRRRLWWQIYALDIRASENRGSESVFAQITFSTKMPCNLNDEDFRYDSQHPLHEKTGPTEITLCLLSMDALTVSRKVCFTSSANDFQTLKEQVELITEYSRRIETIYLANCDFSDQRTKLLRVMGQYWTHKLWMILYYPLQHRKPLHQVRSRTQGMKTAVTLLNINELVEQHPSSAGYAWLFKSYVPWHAVAVILAEICTEPHGHLADRAWEIIQSRFKFWNGRISDIKEVMIWGVVKNLLRRARAARKRGQELFEVMQALHPSDVDSILQDFNAPGLPNPSDTSQADGTYSFDSLSFDDVGLFNQATELDLLPLTPNTTMMAAGTENSTISDNLDNWNDFIFDVNSFGAEMYPNI